MRHYVTIALTVSLSGFVWLGLMEWLRHRSYKKHIASGFAPSTQGLLLLGLLGVAVGTVVAITLVAIGLFRQ